VGQGGHVPPIFMKGDISVVMSPNILEVVSFWMSTRVTTTVVCRILTQILCVVSQKASASGGLRTPDVLSPLRPWTTLGDFVPKTPYKDSAPGPRWGPRTQSSFIPPLNNPVRSTPLIRIPIICASIINSLGLDVSTSAAVVQ